ncbi:M14 family zinc carboxypeptidase [Catenovulum maritimum]|uniref:Zinc carboxypeptidase n=1 Tax=Catenovulum maritimum TaxID=1513271 RepID=A0A0J8GSK0_9ALTE|nr:M14 family zinc carboxypeptidase [Catenovulum maritimum]KMT63683.1 zinc carboxypeptidase [Catenovulum maritimum]
MRYFDGLLPELKQIQYIIDTHQEFIHLEKIATVNINQSELPIYAISLGNQSSEAPVITFVGGVHGLERIGTQVVISFLETLLGRIKWDKGLKHLLSQVRVNFIPLLNPVGMALHKRSNFNSVDLMRNSPTESHEKTAFLVGGHRISPIIPWYRGPEDSDMETESKALVNFIKTNCFQSPFSLVLDCHSGFGLRDRLWFPYAKSKLEPIPHIGEIYHLRDLLFQTYPHQNYVFEPQSKHYLCHGDLWDHLYDLSLEHTGTFLPLTLEMGSWRWVKKNPLQVLKSLGLFHPMKPHRVKRVLRSHLILMDFLMSATASYQNWLEDGKTLNMAQRATRKWYDN